MGCVMRFSVLGEDVFFFFCKHVLGARRSLLLTKGRRSRVFNTQLQPAFLPLLTSPGRCWQASKDSVPFSPLCGLHPVKYKLTRTGPFTREEESSLLLLAVPNFPLPLLEADFMFSCFYWACCVSCGIPVTSAAISAPASIAGGSCCSIPGVRPPRVLPGFDVSNPGLGEAGCRCLLWGKAEVSLGVKLSSGRVCVTSRYKLCYFSSSRYCFIVPEAGGRKKSIPQIQFLAKWLTLYFEVHQGKLHPSDSV